MQIQNFKKTGLIDIPKEWSLHDFGSCCEFKNGKSNTRINFSNDGNIPVYGANGIIGYDAKLLIDIPTIVIGRVGEYCGSIHITDNKSWATDNTIYLDKLNDLIDLKFLYYYLKNYNVNKLAEKTGQPKLNQEILRNIKIILPTKQEQQKIASIFSNVDNLIQKTDQVIEQTQRLKKGLMQRLLTKGIGHTKFKKTELGEIPEEWNIDKLGNVSKVLGGYAFKSKDYLDKGVRLLRITDVSFGYIYSNNLIYLPERYLVEYAPFSLQEDDIVIVLTRPITSGGIKIASIKKHYLPLLLNQRVGKFIVKDNKKLVISNYIRKCSLKPRFL